MSLVWQANRLCSPYWTGTDKDITFLRSPCKFNSQVRSGDPELVVRQRFGLSVRFRAPLVISGCFRFFKIGNLPGRTYSQIISYHIFPPKLRDLDSPHHVVRVVS